MGFSTRWSMMLMMLPASPLGSCLANSLRQQKRRAQIGLHMRVPALACGALPVVILEQRRRIDQGGERPQSGGGMAHQRGGLVFAGKIGLEGGDRHALGARLRGGLFRVVRRAMIMQRDVPARPGQIQDDGPSQPFRRAGDQKVFH